MTQWLGWDISLRVGLVGLIGLLIAPWINWAIYNLAYGPRPISPWFRRRYLPLASRDAQWQEFLATAGHWSCAHWPIFGWWTLRHETRFFGKYFWLRPCCLEVLFPLGLGWWYWYETSGGLLPRLALPPSIEMQAWLHLQFVAHAILGMAMIIATFIDFDERTIPDSITIPGTLIGLIGAACSSRWHLPIDLTSTLDNAWPSALTYDAPWRLATYGGSTGLWLVLSSWTLWILGLLDRRWIRRRGFWKACQYFFLRLIRNPSTRWLLGMWLLGSLLVVASWPRLGLEHQQSLLSSALGMVLGGLTVWLVRWVAGTALGVEALGFGDVTLMAMVGAFLGWQPAMIGFFLAPMIALLFVGIRYLITGDNQTAFGPYLCAAVQTTLLFWDDLWNHYFQDMLEVLGPLVFQILFAGLLLMGGLLACWRLIRDFLGRALKP
jgi:leader peptidase (prepilin peptidase)/N-methyltransferase